MSHLENQDVQLFVYFAWETRDDSPILSDEQVRQAAHQAIQCRIRTQLCHVIAMVSTSNQIHLIARFPASMPIKEIVHMARDAAQEAIFRCQEMLSGLPREMSSLWQREFTAQTVSATEASQAQAYLQQRIGNFRLAAPQVEEAPA